MEEAASWLREETHKRSRQVLGLKLGGPGETRGRRRRGERGAVRRHQVAIRGRAAALAPKGHLDLSSAPMRPVASAHTARPWKRTERSGDARK